MQALERWKEEKRSAWLYRILSDLESGTPRQLVFLELAKDADDQSAVWAQEILNAGLSLPASYQPDLPVRIIAWLTHRCGPRQIRLILAAMNIRGLSVYSGQHLGKQSVAAAGGMREVVFGVNDGLVFIALLVMGVTGATSSRSAILLAGIVGLLVGAFAMAVGEYISIRSQREMLEYQSELALDERAQYLQAEVKALALIYHARGMDENEAYAFAQRMVAAPEMGWLDELVQQEPNLTPDQLGPSLQVAMFSFFAFISGGVIPMLPFMLGVPRHPLLISIVLTCVALFVVGVWKSLFTRRQALWGGFRTLGMGCVAGIVVYWFGSVLGARVS